MRSVLVFLLAFYGSTVFGQSIIVTPLGIRDSADTGKTFVVMKIDSTNAKQLYDNALKYLNKMYVNPEKVLKGKIENEYLKYETHKSNLLVVNNSGAKIPVDADYTIELNFKDGKAKYEIIALDMHGSTGGYKVLFTGGLFSGYPIYNKKGELKRPETKKDVENYFNSEINMIKSYLNGQTGNPKKEDW